MKKLLLPALAISVIAVVASLRFGRPPVNDTVNPAAATISLPTVIDPPERNNAFTDAVPPAAAVTNPPPVTPPAQPGNVISVPGFPPLVLSRTDAPWEATIGKLANRADLPDKIKARFLLQMLPGLPPEVIARAAEEAVNRVADSDYREVVLPAVKNPATHGMAMSVLFADLMQRPATISLPILLTIAQDANHPYSPFAKENLGLLLDRDLGADWVKWDEAIQVHLGTLKK